ncbi:N-acetyltransferase [Candidatus Falkowbacteria bacterium CG10_big_fil_rev_8_21_14_0_10_43_11]|uniref:N-acetyltransferase n=1 Tax=Candidatus Falkowbacteria bacterium CG10_big_fil_rev_8_21_14_0_10_43_11 TaxID=1974568 RepID=A0A2M6WLB4_9BACT|nr:MAG: N-acetyltransferase [Candidatus Falkowbacteria bacterium CG10_big_fil_rev_8_21_14_0_10_43_11]
MSAIVQKLKRKIINIMPNSFLTGNKIYLRQIAESDLTENYQSWFNNPEICRFNAHHRFPNYKQNMTEYYNSVIKSRNNLILAIIDKKNNKHIGNVSLQDMDLINKTAELAIIIGDKFYWGKGVGREALQLIISHGFDSLNLNRVYCGTSEDNISMQKLAESIGFIKEGVLRQALYKNGRYQDIINYGLLKDDYRK